MVQNAGRGKAHNDRQKKHGINHVEHPLTVRYSRTQNTISLLKLFWKGQPLL